MAINNPFTPVVPIMDSVNNGMTDNHLAFPLSIKIAYDGSHFSAPPPFDLSAQGETSIEYLIADIYPSHQYYNGSVSAWIDSNSCPQPSYYPPPPPPPPPAAPPMISEKLPTAAKSILLPEEKIKKTRGRKKKLWTAEEQDRRRQNFLCRNRAAASKCRKKSKIDNQLQRDNKNLLADRNNALRAELQALTAERDQLLATHQRHQNECHGQVMSPSIMAISASTSPEQMTRENCESSQGSPPSSASTTMSRQEPDPSTQLPEASYLDSASTEFGIAFEDSFDGRNLNLVDEKYFGYWFCTSPS